MKKRKPYKKFYTAEEIERRKLARLNRPKIILSKERIINARLYGYKHKDAIRGWDICDYTFEELMNVLGDGECYYCKSNLGLGLDRIDNFKGHTKANTIVACSSCNKARNSYWTVEEFKAITALITQMRSK